jgi:signal transduction histidine kinase
MLDRLSIRGKLAAAFAAALFLILSLSAVFVYAGVSSDLDESLDENLRSRADDVASLVATAGRAPPELQGQRLVEGEDALAQVLAEDGTVLASTLPAGTPLSPQEVERAASGPVLLSDREVPGVAGEARILARPVTAGEQELIVVVGATTEDRAETLTGLRYSFLIGAPIALLLASGLGYLLAGRALAPVDAMRRRASEITLRRSGERLPLPRADDEIHQLGATLNSMLDRIEASLEREREFVADAGHELRTPLAILRTELELAEREGRSAEELRAAISSAVEETDRLSQLAEDLLVIARSDQGRLPIKRESVELGELLERVRHRFGQRAADAGRDMHADAPDGARADLDPLRMEQALGNLVDNALRHGAGGVEIRAVTDGGRVVFEVRDHGAGFPDDFSERAFERFSRADEGRTGGGAGLGLAIVQAIAKAHGGDARVNGAGVVLTLPA